MNRIYQGRTTTWKNVSAAPFDAAEKEALVLPMCPQRQGNGLRSLLCLDSATSQDLRTRSRNFKL